MFDEFEFCLNDADTCVHLKDFVANGRMEMWLKDLKRDKKDFESYYRAMKQVILRKKIDNPPALAAWYMRDKNWEKLAKDADRIRIRTGERQQREKSPFLPGRIFCRHCNGQGWYAVKEHNLNNAEREHVDLSMSMSGTVVMTSSRGHYAFQCVCSPDSGPRKTGDGAHYDPVEQEAARVYGEFLRSPEGSGELVNVMKGFAQPWQATALPLTTTGPPPGPIRETDPDSTPS